MQFPNNCAEELRTIIEKDFNGVVDWDSLGRLINIFNDRQFPCEPSRSTVLTVLMSNLKMKLHFN